MTDWFHTLAAGSELSPAAIHALQNDGFVVVPGPVPQDKLARLAAAYDRVILEADPADVSVGSTTTRVNDFVNRGAEFDELYVHPPVLSACCHVLGQPFRLSTLLARTLRPWASAQGLHVDFQRDAAGWTLLGFIFMIDEFRPDNGATCFLPGSHESPVEPGEAAAMLCERLVPARGPAGSVLIFNGSVWHGHGANITGHPRRSIQGAYIRRDAKPAIDFASRMTAETLSRIGPLARYVLAV